MRARRDDIGCPPSSDAAGPILGRKRQAQSASRHRVEDGHVLAEAFRRGDESSTRVHDIEPARQAADVLDGTRRNDARDARPFRRSLDTDHAEMAGVVRARGESVEVRELVLPRR